MKSTLVRQKFLDFFASKDHRIVDSAPMVTKSDPTLMFTNAGMNQFKDSFLGHKEPAAPRIANTQKCLRVSGKHNDLEEVGRDSYHQTMFEMLGNWSFGDYFKKEAIEWAWELLTGVYGLPEDRFYVTVFGGDEEDALGIDEEARNIWESVVPAERVLFFGKKDNFWEMGDTGPCGPCSEIHIDLRSDDERAQVPGAELVNADNPEVIELWNLVFIQYNRKADGILENLPQKHIDTGMGFERLCMVIQGKKANYDSDVFQPMIHFIEQATGITYTGDYTGKSNADIAMRVVADHCRALFFGIIDGQLPSNTGAGYVLRRILRRAVRYYYSFLNVHEPFMHRLVPLLSDYFDGVFPGVKEQAAFAREVIREEERSFLRTLESGLKRFDSLEVSNGTIPGREAFELYDTYGFPIDLTRLIAAERGLQIDESGFEQALEEQKERSRAAARKDLGDWVVVRSGDPLFVGYDRLEVDGVHILKYRQTEAKGKTRYQIVLDVSPFYPEGGGQVGDTGYLESGQKKIKVYDCVKENELHMVITEELPEDLEATFTAVVDARKRHLITNNHTATHLLHAALREVLGEHVEQKGSLLNDNYLRFDFSHFHKMTPEEIREVERIVNARIRQNIPKQEDRAVPIEEAKAAGAMMLFGEKYGDHVRMITFDPDFSVELCGGCHVESTGQIGLFKIVSESAIAAGVRRVEAITATRAEEYVNDRLSQLDEVLEVVKHPKDVVRSVETLIEENKQLSKQLEEIKREQVASRKGEFLDRMQQVGEANFLAEEITGADSGAVKDLVYQLIDQVDNAFVLLATTDAGKVQMHLGISKDFAGSSGLNAGQIIRELAKHIQGGGGGQPFYASAGGKNAEGLPTAFDRAREMLVAVVG